MHSVQVIRLFSRKEKYFYTLLCVLLIGWVAYNHLTQSALMQRKLDFGNAEKLATIVSGELGNAVGIMSSLTSVQQVLDDPYGDQLDSFATTSLQSSTLIKSLGRYERVDAENLTAFVRDMTESGLYNFYISTLDEDGNKSNALAKSVYYPIVWKQPFSPLSATMIGVDMSSNSDIFKSIQHSELNNSVQIITLPNGWNTFEQNNLLLVSPTYFGRYTPEDSGLLATQSNGGVLMSINLMEFIEQNSMLLPGYDIEIWLEREDSNSSEKATSIHYLKGKSDSDVRLSSIFTGMTQTSSPLPGNQLLRMTVKAHGGIHKKAINEAILLAFITCLVLAILFALFYAIRQRDIAHRRDRESALTTLKAIGDAVITTDTLGNITYANPSTEQLLNTKDNELIGKTIFETVNFVETSTVGSKQGNTCKSLGDAMKADAVVSLPELQIATGSGQPVFVSSTVSPLNINQNNVNTGHVLVMRDISAERELTRELAFLATHDSLTKISNRYHFERELRRLVIDSNKRSGRHAVCYIDLDQFKTINDTCGHSAGDQLLVRVSQGLNSIIRSTDLLARLGGDEFGLLITNCNEEEAVSIAERVYNYFQTLYFQHEEDVFAVRASIGFVHMAGQFDDIENVMAAVDLACYSAKDRGRNELYIFNHYNDETSDRMSEMMWLPKLQVALRDDQFRLYVQPIVDLSNNDGTGSYQHYEILLRLSTEDGGVITPAQLIVAAERYNLMRDMDRWVISNAMRFIASLGYHNDENPIFSINISGQSSVDLELPEFIKQQITNTGINPGSLVFEITETAAITNMQSAVQLVNFLHEIGCQIALDDFGSGVSSFGYLKSLPVDYLKIDGQFIKNIDVNAVDKEMVKCMKAVAEILGIEIVAEFVERAEIVDVLRELNVEYAQGYYYSKPHPIEDLMLSMDNSKVA